MATGTFLGASEITGIPRPTLMAWAKQDWWDEKVKALAKLDTDQIKSISTRIAIAASNIVEDRLKNGEEVITKDGKVQIKQIGARDAAVIGAIYIDKRRQLQQDEQVQPTQNSQEKLVALMDEFARLAKASRTTNIIDAEVVECPVPLDTNEITNKSMPPKTLSEERPEASEIKLAS